MAWCLVIPGEVEESQFKEGTIRDVSTSLDMTIA
jgi:hypothetical protein